MRRRRKLKGSDVSSDLQAGLTVGLESIPDGMASALLSGVNPVNGIHASMMSITIGGLTTSSELITVTTTNAMDLAAGLALASYVLEARTGAILTITLFIGLFTLIFGLLKVGRLTALFSHGAMIGFITGAALLVILSRLGSITGYDSPYQNTIQQAVDVILHINQIDFQTLAIAVLTIVLAILLGRTRVSRLSLVIAVVLASAVAILLNLQSVPQVKDIGTLTNVIPSFQLPDPSFIDLNLITWALAIAIIGMVQFAGLSQNVANPDGRYPDISKDFVGQGVCNTTISFLQGMPTGGSISATALNLSSGAKSRLANISAGVFMLALLLFVGEAVLMLSIPALSAILMIAGYQAIRPNEIRRVWKSSMVSRIEMVVVFVTTLAFPLYYAVFLGVILSALLHVYRSASQVEVVEMVPIADGGYSERPAPKSLESNKATLLEIHGSLLYAGAWTVERNLPSPFEAKNAVVILRMHGQSEIGITLIGILERYDFNLKKNGGKLMLAGVTEKIVREMERTNMMVTIGRENVFLAGNEIHGGISDALASAERWIREKQEE